MTPPGSVRRLGPKLLGVGQELIRRLPAPLLLALARLHRPVARYLAAAKFRRKYRGFVSRLHPEDDLVHYSIEFARSQGQAFGYYRGLQMYFGGGEWNAAEVEKVLADAGFPLSDAASVLEFAAGYGRLTRHFVRRMNPSKLTVSDIDRRAVDFATERFGVRGFYSADRAETLIHPGGYDVIVVVSLFSHLPIGSWGPWLERLHGMLHPGGVLMFSTLGMHAFEVNVNEADRAAFSTLTDGFHYRDVNETRGRLSADQYGVAYVSDGYVQQTVSEHFGGRLVSFVPRALNGFQDAYVLQRAGEAAPPARRAEQATA